MDQVLGLIDSLVLVSILPFHHSYLCHSSTVICASYTFRIKYIIIKNRRIYKCISFHQVPQNFFNRSEDKTDSESEANFVKTRYQKRGTNSIASTNRGQAKVVPPYRAIDCNINSEITISCRRERNEVFLPFSFIKKYFEVKASHICLSEKKNISKIQSFCL